MLSRLRDLIDLARAVQAVPHLIKASADLELRLGELEKKVGDVEALAREVNVGRSSTSTHTGGGRS
jgi:hypothetical protein